MGYVNGYNLKSESKNTASQENNKLARATHNTHTKLNKVN